jgi:hypothetical protein
MESNRFDGLSRLLAGTGSRRGALKAAFAVAIGSTTLAGLTDEASARPRVCRDGGLYCTRSTQCCSNLCRTGKRVPKALRNTCACVDGLTQCGKKCRNLASDPAHCGACNQSVDREIEICCNGVATLVDEANCGACGNVCGGDETCIDRECVAPEPEAACYGGVDLGEACNSPADCCSLNCSGGVCVVPDSDCVTYTGSNLIGISGFALGVCFVEAGQTLGVTGTSNDLYCGGSATPDGWYDLQECTSREDCQAYADAAGRSDLIGVCMTASTLCFAPSKCQPIPSPDGRCEFFHSASSSCPT